MEATTAARASGTVSSTSRFHLRVRCGGHNTSTRRKPARWAAEAAMNVFPVPISPTTVVPRWSSRERAAPRMASACAPRGVRSRRGRALPAVGGPVAGRVGLHHPLGDGFAVGVDEFS